MGLCVSELCEYTHSNPSILTVIPSILTVLPSILTTSPFPGTQVNIATIAGSRHVGPIKVRVEEWGKQLSLFSETLVSVNLWGLAMMGWAWAPLLGLGTTAGPD